MDSPYRDAPPAMVRFFGLVAPSPVGDTSYAYLTAIAATGAKVRALPIGPAAALGFEKRWWRAGSLFTVPITKPYVNVVCAPLNYAMGASATAGPLATKDDLPRDLPPAIRQSMKLQAELAAARPEKIYTPATVLEGFWTKGCVNVAIVTLGDQMLGVRERHALEQYDRVLCPRMEDTQVLNTIGLKASYWPADEVTLQRLEDVCGSGTLVTTVASPATPAQPVTTSSRSTTSTTSNSRSPSSATTSGAPSRAIAPWTPWRFGSIASWVQQTWRSFTRRLVFWRR